MVHISFVRGCALVASGCRVVLETVRGEHTLALAYTRLSAGTNGGSREALQIVVVSSPCGARVAFNLGSGRSASHRLSLPAPRARETQLCYDDCERLLGSHAEEGAVAPAGAVAVHE